MLVLVTVAILMLFYFVQIDTLFAPGLPSKPAGIEEHPWVLEELLAPDGEEVKRPGRRKLQLDEPFSITTPVSRNEAQRGEITVSFDTNGRIDANWQCTYEQTGTAYHIDAEMNGNIDPKRTYRDEQGKDKARLFFIARGRYTKTPLNADAGGEKGTAWLTGWIDPDRSIRGFVTLTQNQQWAAAYAFGNPEKDASMP